MGYYTTYTLSTTQGYDNQEEIEEKLQEISGYSIEFGCNDSYKWYIHEQDMKELSKIYPETTFLLEGEGEDSEDIWRKYFKNGKMQACKAKIVFPAFDESKLV